MQKITVKFGVKLADIPKHGLRDPGGKKVWQIVFESKPINIEWKALSLYMKIQPIHVKKPERTGEAKGLPLCRLSDWVRGK